MLFVSILTSERSQDPELWATIWQGDPPPSVELIGAYNLMNDKRVFIWTGESIADIQYMDRFNQIGVFETSPAFDRTTGWGCALAGDLEGWRTEVQRPFPRAKSDVDAGVDLRRRAMNSSNTRAARAAAREWQREQDSA
ncbi:hypothetical protein M1N23_01320 [Dehalococcoidia bacterium]|nr:hypothetical protein [Dehalococcoidia bacterium]